MLPGWNTVLVLGGGNALGAYHLGVCEALLARGEPDRIVGCSIGAVTGAILLGNPPARRLDRVREFWQAVALQDEPWTRYMPPAVRARWSNGLGLNALLAGRAGLSLPRFPGLFSLLPGMPPDVSTQDHRPMGALLDRLVDWERLAGSEVEFLCLAADLESGEEAWWSNRTDRISAQHILAATALPPLLPPVEIGGRWLWDGGLANNLPLDRAFQGFEDRPVLCVASDLYAPEGARPTSLDGAALRAQYLMFAFQSRKRIEALERERALRRRASPDGPGAVLLHLIHRPPGHQRALKALDFSATAIEERAAQGRADAEAGLDRLDGAPRDQALAVLS